MTRILLLWLVGWLVGLRRAFAALLGLRAGCCGKSCPDRPASLGTMDKYLQAHARPDVAQGDPNQFTRKETSIRQGSLEQQLRGANSSQQQMKPFCSISHFFSPSLLCLSARKGGHRIFSLVNRSSMSSITETPAPQQPKKQKQADAVVWRFNDDPMPKVLQTGGCHCGAVRFRIQHEVLTRQPGYHIPVKMCNCSICGRNGYLLIYPERHEIEWISGEDALVDYKFATEKKAHRFCGRCGSSICMDMTGSWKSWAGDVVGINVSSQPFLLSIIFFPQTLMTEPY